jgi:hypothetical protein
VLFTRHAPRRSTFPLRAFGAAALVLGLVLVVAASAWAALSIAIDPLPGDQTNSRTPSFTFTPDASATTVECLIDGGTPEDCDSPYAPTTPLSDGRHTFTVRVADDNEEQTADYVFTVDTTPPALSIDAGQAGPTNSETPSLTFTAGGDATTVQCWIDGGTPEDCDSPYTPATPLSDGRHTFHVQASDALGNPASDQLEFTVDTTPPALSIDAGQAGPTNSETPSLTFTAGGDATSVQCWIDGGTPEDCDSPYTPAPLSDGRHTFHVQASDALGNASPVADLDFTVDTVRPAVTVTSGPTITSSHTPSFGFTATDADLASVECSIDQGVAVYVSCDSPYTPALPLPDGRYTFRVRALDRAGNEGRDAQSFTVDSAAPSLAIDSGPPPLTNQQRPSFVECSIDHGTPSYAACSSPFTPAGALPDGTYTFHVRAIDSLGHRAEELREFTVDTTPPPLSITFGPSGTTSDSTPLFGFTAEAGATLACSIDQGTPSYGPCASATTHAASAPLADGAYVFRVLATDAAGNRTTATRAFTVDAVADAPAPRADPTPTPAPSAPQLMSPFPLVRISGTLTSGGAHIRLLSVRAPRGALVRVTVRPACGKARRSSRRCRVLHASGTVGRRAVIGFRSLARTYRNGTVIVVLVGRADRIGKYTRFTIVRGKAPRRVDQCLMPGATRGSRCPSD